MLHKNKIIVFTVILFSFGIYSIKNIYIPANKTETIQNSINPSLTAYEQLKQELHNQEQKAWNILLKNTCVSKEECLEKQKKNYSTYKRLQKQNQQNKLSRYPKLKNETINFVQNIVRDLGVHKDIQIIPYKGHGSPAAADDSSIFIDEEEFGLYTPEACKFFIAHEISHLQMQDQSLYKAICSVINRKKIPNQKKENAINTFKRFQEIRADVNALLRGEKYACGAFKFFNKLQELDGGDNPGITHPKTSKRRQIAQDICSKMGWNIENIA